MVENWGAARLIEMFGAGGTAVGVDLKSKAGSAGTACVGLNSGSGTDGGAGGAFSSRSGVGCYVSVGKLGFLGERGDVDWL